MAEFEVTGDRFEHMLRDAEKGMPKVAEMRERITEIVGRAEAADGRITAEYTSEGGLSVLDLDPRALRLPSTELSQEIRAAVNAAAKDFQSQLNQVTGELFGSKPGSMDPPDPAAALAQVEKMGNAFAGQMKDLLQELTAQQRRAQEAVERSRNL